MKFVEKGKRKTYRSLQEIRGEKSSSMSSFATITPKPTLEIAYPSRTVMLRYAWIIRTPCRGSRNAMVIERDARALDREAHGVLLPPPLKRSVLEKAQGANEGHDDDAAGQYNDVLERDRAGFFRPRRFASFTVVTRLAIAD